MNEHTFLIEVGANTAAARASNPAHRGRKFTTAVDNDKDLKQVSHDHCFMRDQPEMESAKTLVSKDRATRMVSAHVVPLKGAVIGWSTNALEIWSDRDTTVRQP